MNDIPKPYVISADFIVPSVGKAQFFVMAGPGLCLTTELGAALRFKTDIDARSWIIDSADTVGNMHLRTMEREEEPPAIRRATDIGDTW